MAGDAGATASAASSGSGSGSAGGLRATWWPRLRLPLLFALAAALSGFTILREIGPHDEGLMLQAAQRISGGQWPYRDFWWNYGPAQPLLLALPIKLFGSSLLWWRIVRVAIDATVALLAYRLVRRAAPEWLALSSWITVAAAMAWPTGPGPNPAAIALVLAALLLVRRHPRWAGVLCGVAVAFRPEIGIAGAIAVAVAGGGLTALIAAAAVAVVALLPFFVVAPGAMLDDTVGFLGVQHLQRLPFPLHYRGGPDPNKLLEFYLPAILVAATALWAVWAAIRRPRWALAAIAPLLVGVAYISGRPDEFHLVPLAVVLTIVLALAVSTERAVPWRAGLLLALALIGLHGIERRVGQLRHPIALAAVPSPVADGVKTTPADAAALAHVLAVIHDFSCPGGPIFVAPPRFDKVTVGDPLLYVLAQRTNPTRYDVIQPGIATTAKVQREMIGDLQRARPRVLVRWLDPRATPDEPNGSSRSSGVRLLDDYLAAHYGGGVRYGSYVVFRRRGPGC
ncbi:MAG: hypothetical protein JWP17_3288 [Solirubrobacterales bacterium]|nr:hypothetical protein [Solirubrobacterales bacterium]